jgi:hypothetical protein
MPGTLAGHAEVEVCGAEGRKFDGKVQQIDAKIEVATTADIEVIVVLGER